MSRIKQTVLLVVWLAASATADAGMIYNAAADFSPTNNPNGVWSYGSKLNLAASLDLYTSTTTFADGGTGGGTIDIWYNVPDIFTAAFHNGSSLQFDSTDPGPGLLPGELALHAGATLLSVARFTAPSAGSYSIDVSFFGVTADTSDVYVAHNGSALFTGTHAGFAPGNVVDFSQLITLNLGDTIEFAVGRGGGDVNVYDWVGLDATITDTAVPEPASLTLFGLGALGLAIHRRRQTRGRAS